jgi:hypothetical protein
MLKKMEKSLRIRSFKLIETWKCALQRREIYYISFVIFISCGQIPKTNFSNENSLIDSTEVKSRTVISDELYLSIDFISNGDSWVNESENQFFYRLIFSSIEESKYIYLELIEIQEEGPLKFIKRESLNSNIFGSDYYEYYPELVKWYSSKDVELKINRKSFLLDVKEMKAEQIVDN